MWKPRKKTTLRCAAVLAAALAFPALNATSAQAIDWDHTLHTDDGDPGGRLRFEAHGDIVEICDIEADGWAVEVSVEGYHYYDTFSVGGNGKCKTHRASGGYDLTEGSTYAFTLDLVKDGVPSVRYEDYAQWKA
ncbi:hypothetical protein [Streptomyces avicenniae]|uniref:hypothetical protein n=1 Tax=Streptomyces avicenniae TaxID=500153 RepID=UPI00069BE194|nr:hypothetical protein [Streptomyces avicenniae]